MVTGEVEVPPEKKLKTAVLLCKDLENLGEGLDLVELQSSLETSLPGVAVGVVPQLCSRPAQLAPFVARHSASRLVLGLCSGEYPQIEVQARVRKAGLDPFGVEVVPLGTLCARVHPGPQATWKAGAMLAAAVEKARAFEGSGPEHAKPYLMTLNQRVSRRSLFTIPPVSYKAVPSIRRERCVAGDGCQLCTIACPQGALQRAGGNLVLDRGRCEGCGVCLVACPRDAIQLPGHSLRQLEAQLAVLLDRATSRGIPCGIVLTCQRTLGNLEKVAHQGAFYPHHWLPVTVPCLGMVTPSWILQVLACGIEAVALLSCTRDCPLGEAQTIGGRANFCRRLLTLLGQPRDRVRALDVAQPERLRLALEGSLPPGEDLHRPLGKDLDLGTLDGLHQAIRCLVRTGGTPSGVALEHPYSPFGALEFRNASCTACLTCVATCPTGALASGDGGDEVTLTWSSSLCNGCGACAATCPGETPAIPQVRRTTDLDTLSLGRVVLHRERLAVCDGCGASVASEAMLQHLERVLKGGSEALRAVIGRYCASCRVPVGLGAELVPAHNAQAVTGGKKGDQG